MSFPGGRTDVVVLLDKPGRAAIDGLTLDGSAFVITRDGDRRTVTMLAPGVAKQGEKVLLSGDSPGAATTGR